MLREDGAGVGALPQMQSEMDGVDICKVGESTLLLGIMDLNVEKGCNL